MATVISFHRRRPLNSRGAPTAADNEHSAEAFWRNSMVPASIAVGVIIVAAVATLAIAVKTGWLGHDYSKWVLTAALVSMIGLTKIVIANMFFFLLMQDDARLEAPPAPMPGIRLNRRTRPLRAISARARRRPSRRTRIANLSAD